MDDISAKGWDDDLLTDALDAIKSEIADHAIMIGTRPSPLEGGPNDTKERMPTLLTKTLDAITFFIADNTIVMVPKIGRVAYSFQIISFFCYYKDLRCVQCPCGHAHITATLVHVCVADDGRLWECSTGPWAYIFWSQAGTGGKI